MATRKKSWLTYKSQLPKNWIQEVQKLIKDQGHSLTPIQIRDTRANKVKDIKTQELVWSAIKQLKVNHQRKIKKVNKLKDLA